jgi:hypothetical protein
MTLISSFIAFTGCGLLGLAALMMHERMAGRAGKTGIPAAELRQALHQAVTKTVLYYDKDAVFGTVVPAVLFMVLPSAALLNFIQGGSPFMIGTYLLIVASILLHLLLAEITGTALIRALLAGVAAVLALSVLPYYAVWSLTDHIIKSAAFPAAMAGILIAVILYAANAGVWTILHTGTGRIRDTVLHQWIASFLFAMPIGYTLYWYVQLAVEIAGQPTVDWHGWNSLMLFSITCGFLFALAKALLDWKNGMLAICGSTMLGVLAIWAAIAVN